MDAVLDPAIEEVTFMVASRLGKTTVEENILSYFVDYDPSPIQIIFPTEQLAKRFSKINLAPMIRDNPHLTERFADSKSRSDDNEILYKAFRGGHVVLAGANSPASLSMYSMRLVMFDEVDRFPASAGEEGDPIELGKQRAENYLNRKFIYSSTPTLEEVSRIESLWNESDQRFLEVPCPHCRHYQILVFGPRSKFAHMTAGYLKYEHVGNLVTSVEYVCANCKQGIPERYKESMLLEAKWKITRPEVKHHAGFHANRLYSPWTTWTEIVRKFLLAEKRYEKIKVWVNTTLGETFSMRTNFRFTDEELLKRREVYVKIPLGVIILTIAIDVQDDRLEAVVKGWGLNGESWFIDRYIAWGSPGEESVWNLMENYIFMEREYENGYKSQYGKLGGVYAVGVDTGGHHTKMAYDFVKKYARSRFFGIKGVGGFGKVFVKHSKNKRVKAPLIIVGVDAGKQLIYERLQIQQLRDDQGNPLPTPGYMHMNMKCTKDYFDGLVSERAEIKGEGLNKTIVWTLPDGKTNEPLDCENYNLAAFTLLDIKDMQPMADVLKERMEVFEKNKPVEGSPSAAVPIPTPGSGENSDDHDDSVMVKVDI